MAGAESRAAPGRDFGLRLASALVLAPAALGCLFAGGWLWGLLVAVAGVLMAGEWRRLVGAPAWSQAATAVLAVIVVALGASQSVIAVTVLVAIAAAVMAVLASPGAGLGALYVGLPVAALAWLRTDPVLGRDILLFGLVAVWATDIGAYLVGRSVGGPKLAPGISPGKTWSGLAGGVAAAAAVGWLAQDHLPLERLPLIGAGLALVAQAGDLFKSALKRRAGVKDSGALIPGHGGVIDRVDGVVAMALALAAARLGGAW
ncbi:MAG: phosphatidate cytidylyltransferase [Alphaproteobacteria bacterium]|nr:phosphatidate cytidylyltransferase [Alphaproteobacteria bacterium]